MAHKKLYYVLCALVIVIVFGTAAICNMCGAAAKTTDKTGTDEEISAVTTAKSAASTSDKDNKDSSTESTAKSSDESSSASESTAADSSELPTIKLEIYEGPTYSAGDDICYYRVKAIVTGKPAPTVKFSKDDSSGAWGTKKVQINIHRGSPYTLTATVKNSAGEASASINLTWGCGAENRVPVISDIALSSATIKTGQEYDVSGTASDPDGDSLTYKWTVSGGSINNDTANPMKWTAPAVGSQTITLKVTDGKGGEATQTKTVNVESAIANLSVPKVTTEGGYIESTGNIDHGGDVFAGDSSANSPVRGFVSFDITGLAGKTIDTASAVFNLKETWGIIPASWGNLWVGVVDWGAHPIVFTDFDLSGTGIQQFNPAAGGSFTCNAAALKTQLQSAISAGKSRFQLRIHWSAVVSDGDGAYDGWEYDQSQINLNITYH